MEAIARDVCAAIDNRGLLEPDGASLALTVLRNYFAPDTLDAVCHGLVRFLHFTRTIQTVDANMGKFDALRRKAEGRLQPAGTFLATCEAVLC